MNEILSPGFFEDFALDVACKKVKEHLTVELLKPEYRKRVLAGANPMTGHCYVASEVLYHLFLKELGYKPYHVKHEGSTHWWLQKGDHIIDLTAEQFQTTPPYHLGVCGSFLTVEPSKRARIVIGCVKKDLEAKDG